MKLIIPMAGRGSRLRPHTLTTAKPLIKIAGNSILLQLVKDAAKLADEPIEEMAFIIGDESFFGKEIISELNFLAREFNAKASIYRQRVPLGTGHAIMCAKESLHGKAMVIYPDTLIRFEEGFDKNSDAVIWTKEVKNPEAYGVIKLNKEGNIVDLVEKPKSSISNLAVIGLYYFKEIAQLKSQLQNVIEEKIIHSGEYQINDGLLKMISNGKVFKAGKVTEWLDCGNVKSSINSNQKMLDFHYADKRPLVSTDLKLINSKIIEPVYIDSGVVIENSTVGPHVSVYKNSKIFTSSIKNSILGEDSIISNANVSNSMIGNNCKYDGNYQSINIGDYSELI
jgi:glucose-1-phosphate thymidylyltransferase